MRILIADDDPVYRELVASLLKKWGFEVVLARDGQEAWELLQQPDAPKMVILDWMMPGMDGYEICQRIRQQPAGDRSYILLMTGSKLKSEVAKVLIAGADDYLIKPFEALDLQIHLRTAKRILDLQDEVRELNRPQMTRSSA